MKHIDRLDVPKILAKNQKKWEEAYRKKLATNPKARPDSSKYAHKDIRGQLMTMSYGKCFYCEGPLKDKPKEVDHYIEVNCDTGKAYEWSNLYLACLNCNDKIDHISIPVTDALDPCSDSDETIRENITFNNEIIQPVPGSPKGLTTIKKFRLNSELLDNKRRKWLRRIDKDVREILFRMIRESRHEMTDEEKSLLLQYLQPTSCYSLMSEIFFEKELKELFPII